MRGTAEKEWRRVPSDVRPVFEKAIQRIVECDESLMQQKKKFLDAYHQRARYSDVPNLYTVRASRSYRIFLTTTPDGFELVGFAQRGDGAGGRAHEPF